MVKKETLIFLVGICMIAALVFWRQVVAFIATMTPLEAIDFVMTFVIKAVVLAIISWLVYHTPNLIRPWLRVFRWKQRSVRRGTVMTKTVSRTPHLNKDQMLLWMAGQMMGKKSPEKLPQQHSPDETIRLDF